MSIQETLLKIKGRGGIRPFLMDIQARFTPWTRRILLGFLGCIFLAAAFLAGQISAFKAISQTPEPVTVQYPPLVSTDIPKYQEGVTSQKKQKKPAKAPKQAKSSEDAPDQEDQTDQSDQDTSLPFAASKTGKTYYPKDCKALNRVKPENRIFFLTSAAATEAGYHLSKSCKKN